MTSASLSQVSINEEKVNDSLRKVSEVANLIASAQLSFRFISTHYLPDLVDRSFGLFSRSVIFAYDLLRGLVTASLDLIIDPIDDLASG